jgi:hypothetical protein
MPKKYGLKNFFLVQVFSGILWRYGAKNCQLEDVQRCSGGGGGMASKP